MRTVCGSEFQTVGAENRKARLEKSVLMNGLSSSGKAAERKVRLQAHSASPVPNAVHVTYTQQLLASFLSQVSV